MQSVEIYLHFNGNSEKAMNFYKEVFGGEFNSVRRYKDMPGSEKMSPENRMKMIHISLRITDSFTLMASDVISDSSETVAFGNNYHICLQASGEKEADKLFSELSADGVIEMPMNKTFWGDYFGMCIDRFGIQWMINYHKIQ
ncbi:VOC family protein [Flavihumibacter solisilvae]|uniref:Glyoxalase n=1 Tax=Flavihumibacter solisilvae TaxID=1349421 RepID=A0A0C1LDP9_9BACT|nr:VOC family protein [Flavihumibacter solisilvae]KIC93578.1 glyoxalase [Flavihumibacter solisilvae]